MGTPDIEECEMPDFEKLKGDAKAEAKKDEPRLQEKGESEAKNEGERLEKRF